ncbi:MAG: hypothetical protein QXG83_02630 [Candidatus Pacearchaeota archaeon]
MKRGKASKKMSKESEVKRNQFEKAKTKKSNAGFILALIALTILAINIVFVFAGSTWIETQLKEVGYPVPENFSQLLIVYGILWAVLAIITTMLIIFYENKKIKLWWLMLVLGVIVLLAGRIETAILLIIASFFYKKNLK